MTERRTLGQILTGSGRITEADVERALAHQRETGCLLGEALVAAGVISPTEVEWSLASQFDLPYVFPEADEVDYGAASLVTPEWALEHLTLPILRTDDTLSVIVASPLDLRHVDALAQRTGLAVELALASPARIRELVREVHARGTAAEERAAGPPVELAWALDEVLEARAVRFGVSVREGKGMVWWDDAGTVRRRPLAGDWERELERALEPALGRMTEGQGRAAWSGTLRRAGVALPVEVRFLGDESGRELLFHPDHAAATRALRVPPPPPGIVSEVRLLARSGRARFVVTTDPPSLGHEILPQLPVLLLDPAWRSVYIHAAEQPAEKHSFSRKLPPDPGSWAPELESLRAFRFDVATVDLPGAGGGWMSRALDVGSVAFLLAEEADLVPARDAGIRWRLAVARAGDGALEWSLQPLQPR